MELDLNPEISFPCDEQEFLSLSYHNPQSQTLANPKKDYIDLASYHLQISRVDAKSEETHVSELIQPFFLPPCTSPSRLSLNALLVKIEQDANFHFQGHIVMLYAPDLQLFTNFGLYPFATNTLIDVSDFVCVQTSKQTIRLKVQKLQTSLIHFQMFKNTAQLLLDGPPKQVTSYQSLGPKETKKVGIKNFQKIGYIVKAVMHQKLGRKSSFLQDMRFKLDRKFTKKSIEDYFNQIKLGHKYGYDFNQNSEQNMSHLRNYVKRKELEERSRRHSLQQNHFPNDLEPISNLINHER